MINSELQDVLATLGKNIETRIKEIGMSRKQLAEQVGISQNSVSGYINAKQLPKFETLFNISKALGVSLQELFSGDILALQTKKIVETAKENAVREYEIKDAIEILNNVGWECQKLENGDWQLFRQKTIEDFLEIITDGAKVKYVEVDGDDTLIALGHTVKKTALDTLNKDSAMKTLNEKLDSLLTVADK